jgi:hypothetical protein
MSEPKSYEEEIENARKERGEVTKINPEKRRELVQEQIADALIAIKWALRTKSGKGSTRSAARKKEEAEAFKDALVFGTKEEYEEHIRQHPEDAHRNVILTGVPRARKPSELPR